MSGSISLIDFRLCKLINVSLGVSFGEDLGSPDLLAARRLPRFTVRVSSFVCGCGASPFDEDVSEKLISGMVCGYLG